MKHNPYDRRDNVEKIQEHIDHTIQNMELADELMEKTRNPEEKIELKEKNKRRRDALNGMRAEIRDEAIDRRKGYKD